MKLTEDSQMIALRKLYAKAHQQLQEAGVKILRLEERIAALQADNAALREKSAGGTSDV